MKGSSIILINVKLVNGFTIWLSGILFLQAQWVVSSRQDNSILQHILHVNFPYSLPVYISLYDISISLAPMVTCRETIFNNYPAKSHGISSDI